MVHRCKKYSDISKVTYGGRGEIDHVKNDRLSNSDLHFHLRQQMLLLKYHHTFYIYGAMGKKAFCQILKRWFISWITSLNVQRLQIFAILASLLQGNLKWAFREKVKFYKTCIKVSFLNEPVSIAYNNSDSPFYTHIPCSKV